MMNMIWLCITAVVSITAVICDQKIDTSQIRVFPAANQTIAGVFQVSSLNYLNQPVYAFNASEARTLCSSLGVNIASKAQVREALTRGFETCRFGWIDEHFAVIPRKNALSICGQNQTGLVPWRAPVTQKFDVFCFNESATWLKLSSSSVKRHTFKQVAWRCTSLPSWADVPSKTKSNQADAATQLKDTTSDSPLNSRETQSPTEAADSTQNTRSTYSSSFLLSSSTTPQTVDSEAEPARFVGRAQGSAGGKAILITSTCALLLIAIIIIVYVKLSRARSTDMKRQQPEFIQTEEWTCVKSIKETKTSTQEDERIEVDSDES